MASSGQKDITTMKIDYGEIKKHISLFTLSLIIVHRVILLVGKGTPIASKTCVETEDNTFFCTDNPQEARQKAKKTHSNNFGVRQTIAGNAEDMENMRIMEMDMIAYLQKFIEKRGDGEEWMMEQCTNRDANCLFWASVGECKSNPVRLYFFIGYNMFSLMRLGSWLTITYRIILNYVQDLHGKGLCISLPIMRQVEKR